jgi:SagB-type dehydrogenase family enzyme
MRKTLLLLAALLATPMLAAQLATTAVGSRLDLPAPLSGGMTLHDALAHRRSVRSFQATRLTMPEISQLLWAAQGITDEQGHRTAPSAHAQYFLHLYVALPEGFFEYLPAGHGLRKLTAEDRRATLSPQSSVKTAPAVFIVAGEYAHASQTVEPETALRFVNLEAGMATENLLLEATALHLAVTSVGGIDPKQTAEAAGLPAGILPIFLIPAGHGR